MWRRLLISFLLTVSVFNPMDCLSCSELESKSIGMVVSPFWRGEQAFCARVAAACKNLGWSATVIDSVSQTQFDWVFTFTPDEGSSYAYFQCPNYLVLFSEELHFYNADFRLKSKFCDYSGYLTTSDKKLILTKNKEPSVYPERWYPTVQYRPYQKVIPQKLFHFLGGWGNRRHWPKYNILELKLAEQKYSYFFGNPFSGCKYGETYKGEIPYEGDSIQNQIAELGVCLVLHSNYHIDQAIPSGRIFEAAAASSVIISDMNPFVQKHFGDSVLYVDQNRSGEEIFAEIDRHMQWILTHQEEAQAMAKRSYEIFAKNFLLEDQLVRFAEWHQSNGCR